MPIASVNGVDLYYETSGVGEPVVFIPGLGGTTDLWTFQTRYFKKNYQSISLDNRGAGRSSKPLGFYSMQGFAKDLNSLLDVMEIDQPINLVGASMGGLIAQAFIHEYPKRVKKLVLACTGVSGGDPHVTMSSPDVAKKLMNPGSTQEQKIDTMLEIFYHPDYIKKRPDIKQLFLSSTEAPQPPHAYMAQLTACGDPRPYYGWLGLIDVPTLVIHGDDDLVWPVQNAKTLKEGLGSKGELHIMKKAAHILMQEQPEEFNRVLDEFFKKA